MYVEACTLHRTPVQVSRPKGNKINFVYMAIATPALHHAHRAGSAVQVYAHRKTSGATQPPRKSRNYENRPQL
jgi:hypothetical protein